MYVYAKIKNPTVGRPLMGPAKIQSLVEQSYVCFFSIYVPTYISVFIEWVSVVLG